MKPILNLDGYPPGYWETPVGKARLDPIIKAFEEAAA